MSHGSVLPSVHPMPNLREYEAFLVGEDNTAPLVQVVEHSRSARQPDQFQLVHGILVLCEGEFVEIVMRHHAVLDGRQMFFGTLDVPLFENPDWCKGDEKLKVGKELRAGLGMGSSQASLRVSRCTFKSSTFECNTAC